MAVWKPAPVVMLLCCAARSLVATPFPNRFSVPVELAYRLGHLKNGPSWYESGAACVNARECNEDVAGFALNECRIENYARKPGVFPLMHHIAVKVDQAGDLIGPRERHIAVVGLCRVISGNACGIDARLGRGVEGYQAQR